jgi:hypothetical protein
MSKKHRASDGNKEFDKEQGIHNIELKCSFVGCHISLLF